MYRKRKQTEMFKIVEECLNASCSKKEVIEKYGLRHQTYYYWQQKYLERQTSKITSTQKKTTAFQEINLTAVDTSTLFSLKKVFELTTQKGLTISVYE